VLLDEASRRAELQPRHRGHSKAIRCRPGKHRLRIGR
jgi:hypothetical protein